jgi:hypothetical protein
VPVSVGVLLGVPHMMLRLTVLEKACMAVAPMTPPMIP